MIFVYFGLKCFGGIHIISLFHNIVILGLLLPCYKLFSKDTVVFVINLIWNSIEINRFGFERNILNQS